MTTSTILIENGIMRSAEKSNVWLWLIEFCLYFSMTSRIFGNQLGVLNISGLSGAIIVASGVLCFVVMFIEQRSIPVSIYFALMINVIANITDLYLYELFSRNMVYWLCFQLMACFIVRNERALLRFSLFMASTVFLSVYLGGEFYGRDITRLSLTGGVGSMFANANALAHISALTATALCFTSLKCKLPLKSLSLACAGALSVIVMMTLSRGGLILLMTGMVSFTLAILFSQRAKMDLILLGLVIGVLLIVFSPQIADISDGYQYRMNQDSGRTSYLETAKSDMLDTIFSGQGSQAGFSATGLKPHNAFLWLHLAFGGFCAWFYAAWIAWLGGTTLTCVLLDGLQFPAKMELLAYFLMFFSIQFISIFPPFNFGFVLAIAIIEKHIQERREMVSMEYEYSSG